MRFGLLTPVVTCHPAHHAQWEESAGPAAIARIAVAADRLGYHHLTCSEHVAVPGTALPVRGARYYDPLATLAFVAAQTERVKLATHVLVLPYHHPLALAKRYGTLDLLSGGRLILGVGVGTLEEEFRLLGAEFAGRGPRYEEALVALRAAFGRRQPSHRGPAYEFTDFVVDPCGVQDRVPIWLGGRSPRSLRRALVLGDGWVPFGLGLAALTTLLERACSTRAWRDRTAAFEVVLTPEQLLDPTLPAERDELTTAIARYEAIGATTVNLRFRHRSLAHYLEQLAVFAAEVGPRFG